MHLQKTGKVMYEGSYFTQKDNTTLAQTPHIDAPKDRVQMFPAHHKTETVSNMKKKKKNLGQGI